MYKATRSLIKLRQPHSKALVEKVFVRRIEGGVQRQCYENACLLFEKNKNYKIVSGWFVTEWDKVTSSCLALSHYWNVDEAGNFVDCSPMKNISAEYVIDSEIGIFSSQQYEVMFVHQLFSKMIQFQVLILESQVRFIGFTKTSL